MWLPEISLFHSVMGHPREEDESLKKKAKEVSNEENADSDTDSIGESDGQWMGASPSNEALGRSLP